MPPFSLLISLSTAWIRLCVRSSSILHPGIRKVFPGLGSGFGKAKREHPKHTTCRGSLGSRDTRNSGFPDVLGVKGFRSQRLGSCVGVHCAPRRIAHRQR
jgi:hypothetical protein